MSQAPDMTQPNQQTKWATYILALSGGLWIAQALCIAIVLAGFLDGALRVGPIAIFVGLALLRALIGYWAEGVIYRAALTHVAALRRDIITTESRRDKGAIGSASVMALATGKLDLLLPYFTRYKTARLRVMVVPLAILVVAFFVSWAAGVILLISGPLIPVFMALVGMAAKQASADQLKEMGSLNDMLSERISALVDIRLLNATPHVVQGFEAQADTLRGRTMAVLRIAFLSSTVLELFAAIGVAMMAVYVGFSLLGLVGFGTWGTPITVVQGVFLLLLAPEFYQPLRDLAAAWHDKAAADAVVDEVEEWRNAPRPEMIGAGRGHPPLPGPAVIDMRNVTYRGVVLPDMRVRAGSSVALVGASGAGKTTLLRLLAGLDAPDTGQITVAGVGLSEQTADGWRARIGWIPQHTWFMNASLRQNITFGRDIHPEQLAQAVSQSAMQDVIAGQERGLLTRMGETGAGLSGGEGRRLMMARAISAGADVILADEPTADLDGATAAQIARGLKELQKNGATLVVATHDATLAAQMDQVINVGQNA